jgi:DNA-binding transcriptional regulator GbsR (MarR family)
MTPEPLAVGARDEAAGARDARLADLEERFVLHWGEMGMAWGINRTMAQIHALLYITSEPLSAEEIMARLQISRGNVSMNLRALEDWGIAQRVHYRGDRREYFRTLTDVWELFRTVVRERKRREFDPMTRSLRQFLDEAEQLDVDEPAAAGYRERVTALLEVLDVLQSACDRLLPRSAEELPRLLEIEVEGLD